MIVALVVLAALALLLLGVGLVTSGARGHRVDDHPICRRCGFDLFGAPPGSIACPECGADVTRPGAVRAGNRVRRTGMLAVGVPLTLLTALPLLAAAWVSARGTDLTPYKPAWLLLREARGPDAEMRPALRELSRRLAAGRLSAADVDRVADRALALQAGRPRSCPPPWLAFVEEAHDAGRLDAERWRRYLRQAVTFKAAARPRVRRGDPIPLRITLGDVRLARDRRFTLTYVAPDPLAVGEVALARASGAPTAFAMNPSERDQGNPGKRFRELHVAVRPNADALARLADGRQAARVAVHVTVTDRLGGPPYAYVADLDAPFELVPADRPTVTLVKDPALAETIRRSLEPSAVWVNAKGRVVSSVFVHGAPIGLAFAVTIRAGGREWPVEPVVFPKGVSGQRVFQRWVSDDLGGARAVDLVLRTDPAAAADTLDVTEVWDGELVIPGVPVKRADAAGKLIE